MKKTKLKLGVLLVTIAAFMMTTASAFAAIECFDMKVIMTGTKLVAGSQVNIIRVQRGSTACGDMTTTDRRTFNFSSVNGDAGLAAALTAYSLGQNVYLILTDNNAAVGTTAETIMVTP